MQAMPCETGQIQAGTLIANCPQPKPTRNTLALEQVGFNTHYNGGEPQVGLEEVVRKGFFQG